MAPNVQIKSLLKLLSEGVYEKEQIIAMALLSAIASESIFLLGPPGTAKSLVARRLKLAFKDGKAFEYHIEDLLNRLDEIFKETKQEVLGKDILHIIKYSYDEMTIKNEYGETFTYTRIE